jgi:hypothetical protein
MCSSPSIIRIHRPRRMRLTGFVARMGEKNIAIGYGWKNQRERDL